MLFKPELAQKVLAGEKTQTRRVKNLGERLLTSILGVKMVLDYRARTKWEVGRTYAVQTGRGKPGIGRLKLLDIREEHLQDISEEDAKAELGAPDWPGPGDPPYQRNLVAVFSHLWDSINPPGLRFGHNPEVWVLVFEVVKPPFQVTSFDWMPQPYRGRCEELQAKMIELAPTKPAWEADELWLAAATALGNEDGRYCRIYVCENCKRIYHADFSTNQNEARDFCGSECETFA